MKERTLRVTAKNLCAGAVFAEVEPGRWKAVRAAPILGWMLAHESHEGIATFLKGPGRRNGWRYEWL